MKSGTPLTDLEMFDLLRACYPEKFTDEDDATWDAAQDFAENLSGFDELADLLGRVAMLTAPMGSGLTGRLSHCLGVVTIADGKTSMCAAVRRDAVVPA